MMMADQITSPPPQNPFHRVWFLCKGKPFHHETEEEEAAGMKSENPMKCTTEMTYQQLCCAPWNEGLEFKVTALGSLGGGSTANVQALRTDPVIVKMCTTAASGATLMQSGGQAAASMPTECITRDFSFDDLKGIGGMAPGEIFLRARILFFVKQGIPADTIPTCAKEVSTCPSGAPPATVKDEWLQKVMQDADASSASFLQGGLHTSGSFSMQDGTGFGGGLVASGSFSSMASASMLM